MNTPHKVLIIDDEEVVRDSCTHILETQDYLIQTASDGSTGLALIEQSKPDLVLVDLKMPGLSGMEVLERINSLDASIVTIVITGYASLSSAVEAMKKGAYDFLPKPFTPDELRLITKRGMEKRKLLLDAIALRRERQMIRDHFTSIVSHELKTPLLAVQQNLYVILDGIAGDLNPAQRDMLERIKNRIDALLRMIKTWVEMTSMDTRQLREKFKPLDVPSIVARAVELLQPQASARNVDVRLQSPASTQPVSGDDGTLLEVFTNIIGNAIKFSPTAGQVSIKIEDRAADLRISVCDNGVGIEKQDLPFIFDAFYQGRAQGKDGEPGSGLGLAISSRIIHAHNGSISVESEPGRGSTFTVVLARGTRKEPADVDADAPADLLI